MMRETSVLHIAVPRRYKARWVAAAQLSGLPLTTWVSERLNEAADNANLRPPKWMIAAGFSSRLSQCLIAEGLVTPSAVIRAWSEKTPMEWEELPNFGKKCYRELQAWIQTPR